MTQSARRPRRLPAWAAWPLCVALGLALGWVGRIPLAYAVLSSQTLAAAVGWGSYDPTLVRDGVAFVVVAGAAVAAVFVMVAAMVGWLAWRCTRLAARPWWCTTTAAVLMPFVVLDLPDML